MHLKMRMGMLSTQDAKIAMELSLQTLLQQKQEFHRTLQQAFLDLN